MALLQELQASSYSQSAFSSVNYDEQEAYMCR